MIGSVSLALVVLVTQFTIARSLQRFTRTRLLVAMVALVAWGLLVTSLFPERYPDGRTASLYAVAWVLTGSRFLGDLFRLRGAIRLEQDEPACRAASRRAGRSLPWSGLALLIGLLLPALAGGERGWIYVLVALSVLLATSAATLAGLAAKPRSGWWPALVLFVAAVVLAAC
ncbi:MAG: hypothetical protein OEV00_10660 [Acidobacteriota bacterium]|nr:hypothetical protein [Acidobacteriota bacterium]MDH3785773.1 hypothetical protein [Acidobacteriota bacterium]